jgi:hypothetical protein
MVAVSLVQVWLLIPWLRYGCWFHGSCMVAATLGQGMAVHSSCHGSGMVKNCLLCSLPRFKIFFLNFLLKLFSHFFKECKSTVCLPVLYPPEPEPNIKQQSGTFRQQRNKENMHMSKKKQ